MEKVSGLTNIENFYLSQGGHYSGFEKWEKSLGIYERQGIDFLLKTKTDFKARLVGHDKYFPEDKQARDIYEIIFTRKDKAPFVLRFGASIHDSGPSLKEDFKLTERARQRGAMFPKEGDYEQKRKTPTPYTVLASITKNDPETFEDFCACFGYDSDSRTAEKIYFAVQKEYKEVCRLWDEKERELLQEIN